MFPACGIFFKVAGLFVKRPCQQAGRLLYLKQRNSPTSCIAPLDHFRAQFFSGEEHSLSYEQAKVSIHNWSRESHNVDCGLTHVLHQNAVSGRHTSQALALNHPPLGQRLAPPHRGHNLTKLFGCSQIEQTTVSFVLTLAPKGAAAYQLCGTTSLLRAEVCLRSKQQLRLKARKNTVSFR